MQFRASEKQFFAAEEGERRQGRFQDHIMILLLFSLSMLVLLYCILFYKASKDLNLKTICFAPSSQ